MLNLLFISDSLKAEYIKSVLQPVLKVIIDVVTDFDHGLRDVIDKRPAVVFIQYQIGSVTGESVARHIQMLLGSTSPTFILLHNETDKPKAIKGLYEQLIDLSQPNAVLSKNIIEMLKQLLGDQWDKICIQPTVVTPPILTLSESLESEIFFSDSIPKSTSGNTAGTDPIDVVRKPEHSVVATIPEIPHPVKAVNAKSELSSGGGLPTVPADSTSPKVELNVSSAPVSSTQQSQITPQPADFRIGGNSPSSQDEETIPEDLLLAFEENYRIESRSAGRYVTLILVGVVMVAGCWYSINNYPQVAHSLKQRFVSLTGAKTAPVPVPTPVTPKPVPPPVPQPVAQPSLPSFIPRDGHDSSFAASKPGWERYVGADAEFRLFSDSGRLKAVQVLAVKDGKISDQMLKSVLLEFVGSSEYKVISATTKAGVQIENGTIVNKAEVVVYRKSGSVKAFVVSLN